MLYCTMEEKQLNNKHLLVGVRWNMWKPTKQRLPDKSPSRFVCLRSSAAGKHILSAAAKKFGFKAWLRLVEGEQRFFSGFAFWVIFYGIYRVL